MIKRSTITNDKGEEEPMSYIHAFVVDKTDKATLQPIIQQFVAEGSVVITDELNAYSGLEKIGDSRTAKLVKITDISMGAGDFSFCIAIFNILLAIFI